MLYEFHFVGFTPRDPFKEKANEVINTLAEMMPSDATCSARVVMIDGKFFFQVIFVSKCECFIAKDVLDPSKENTSSRLWQAIALDRIASNLVTQVQSWRDKAAA
ncbi:MAG: hypothetical protein KDD37_01850 [Bdellovibrionales bacterium]|nr:hypothetical protein [Bdellovibrionales bacterium]